MGNLLQAIPFASVVLQEHVWDFPYPSLVATTTEPSSGRRTARDAATNDSEALSEWDVQDSRQDLWRRRRRDRT
ncbi:hypothetical protein ACMYSQ_011394 [Aspergillus niger]